MEAWATGILFFAAMVLGASRRGVGLFARLRAVLRFCTASSLRAGVIVFLCAMILYALPAVYFVPSPMIHDEFGYLLAGDTFSHFRLTNPPHPMAEFFETFHVLQSPTYISKFPVGIGMTLCVGFWIGLPIIGVWLSLATALVALLWMLAAVLPLRSAFITTLVAMTHPLLLYFSVSYWGCTTGILGGALLGGSVLRMLAVDRKGAPWSLGLVAGIGMAILANTRPFEGMLLSIVCAVLVIYSAAQRHRLRSLFMQFTPPVVGVLLITLAFMLYYDWRVTGHPTLMPYTLHTQRYMAAPLFLWEDVPVPKTYPNAQMAKFHQEEELSEFKEHVGSASNLLLGAGSRLGSIAWHYVRSPVLLMPIVAAIATLRRPGRNRSPVRAAAALCAVIPLLHVAMCPWMRVAYMAPIFGMLMVLVGTGLRRLSHFTWRGTELGRVLSRAVVVTQLGVSAVWLPNYMYDLKRTPPAERVRIIDRLTRAGGQHLIIVHYPEGHNPHAEWVFNAADIDAAPVVWARSLGEPQDRELLLYYTHRTTWRLDVNETTCELSPLPQGKIVTHPIDSPANSAQ